MPLDLSSFQRAVHQLEQIVNRSEDQQFMLAQDEITVNAIRAGVIQHFEIVYELSWKFIQRWLRENRSPVEADFPRTRKELFRNAARENLIRDPIPWFQYGDARNLTTHTYHEDTANTVYQQAVLLVADACYLLARLTEKND